MVAVGVLESECGRSSFRRSHVVWLAVILSIVDLSDKIHDKV